MRFEEGFVDMAQEYKIYFSMKDSMLPKDPVSAELQKSIEFQLIKTSAHYFDLDLPEKYKQALVGGRNS
jgi:hypothetical protein